MNDEAEKLISDFDRIILDDLRDPDIETGDDYSIPGETFREDE